MDECSLGKAKPGVVSALRLKRIPFSGLSIRRMQERFLLKVVGWEGAAAVLRFTHTFSQVVQSNMNLSTGVRELSGCNQSP